MATRQNAMIRNSTFSTKLLAWHKINKRTFPWKKTKDPYKIWLSEIILQQTRIEQGLPYYKKFVIAFPNVTQLAQASEDEVLKLWQGLGYYSRARNLHSAAKQIVTDHKGQLPKNHDEWLSIKGVGEYSAAAISSFAFNEAKAVVDGNVIRLLARVFGMEADGKSGKGKRLFIDKANQLIIPKHAAEFNQAIMDYGATMCTPKNPNCTSCIFKRSCIARLTQRISELPTRAKSKPKRTRHFNYFVIRKDEYTFIVRRNESDIWKGLFEFPLIESKQALTSNQAKAAIKQLGFKDLKIFKKKSLTQVLSHQIIEGSFYTIQVDYIPSSEQWKKINWRKLQNFAFPKIIDSYIKLENSNFK